MAQTNERMWFITQGAVELWSSLLQDIVDDRNAQVLLRKIGKLPQKNLSEVIRARDTLPQKDSMQHIAKALKCPIEVLFPGFQLFSMHLVTGRDGPTQLFLRIFDLF